MGFLALSGAYEERFLAQGIEELKRVFNASVRFVAAVALVAYGAKLPVARGFVVPDLLVGTGLLVLCRYLGHRVVRRMRRRGRFTSRVLILGDVAHVAEMAAQMLADPGVGYEVVGACTPSARGGDELSRLGVPVVGRLTSLLPAVRECDADTVAVTASPGVTPHALRRMSWELEGSGVALLVAPGLTDVAGPRIHIRPIGSRLPLLHVEEPEFTGARRVLKTAQDVLLCGVGLLLLAPLLALVALAVKLDSRGPVFFRQTRVGRHGREFTVLKFRSMQLDAEQRLPGLRHLNDADRAGLLFKLHEDPRVTRVGRVLRRYSLDELPQLLNVLRGEMALVGPRPPLPGEVERYGADVRRRLLVKPGITGLWQVSGRSDLSWEDSVRLDLYYVENWSLALDLQIIAKTLVAVARGSGAY
jgi:exopolysaccharide biosynthesis polyprenyl glycosylphosphotransferase